MALAVHGVDGGAHGLDAPSRSISQLEADLGVRLLQRKGGRVVDAFSSSTAFSRKLSVREAGAVIEAHRHDLSRRRRRIARRIAPQQRARQLRVSPPAPHTTAPTRIDLKDRSAGA
jgi:hypothetical protein